MAMYDSNGTEIMSECDDLTTVKSSNISEMILLQENLDLSESAENNSDSASDNEMPLEKTDADDGQNQREHYNDNDADIIIKEAHTKDIFSIDSLDDCLLATGGEDDFAHLWSFNASISDFECVYSVEEHLDSVTFVRFNAKKTLLATGDMSGKIIVTNVNTKTTAISFTDISDLEWLQWHHAADILLAGGGDGTIWMWLIATGQGKVYSTGCTGACTTGTIMPDGKRLLAGYDNGSVLIWDLKEALAMAISGSPFKHDNPIVSLDAHRTMSIAASGCQNGTVCLFQPNTGKFKCLMNVGSANVIETNNVSNEDEDPVEPMKESVDNSVETLSFAPTQPWMVAGTNGGLLTFWDLNTLVTRNRVELPRGITKTLFLDENSLFCASLDGIVRLFDCRNGSCTRQWSGGGEDIFDFTLNRSLNALFTGCAGGTVRVFKL